MDPAGKIVLITGASSGIGAAAACAFAAAGADVVLAARSTDALHTLAASLPGRPLVVPTDITLPDDVYALVQRAIAERGSVDILINNAGIGLTGPVASIAPADLERLFTVDVLGPLYAIQAVVPHMTSRRHGQIINVSSVLAAQPVPGIGGYAAGKAALETLSTTLRMELASANVAVTTVRPSTTRTSFAGRRLGSGGRERWRPTGVTPEAVASTLLRAARHEPRVAYVTLGDRLQVWLSGSMPALVEMVLARLTIWTDDTSK